jgi:hypothetical protein
VWSLAYCPYFFEKSHSIDDITQLALDGYDLALKPTSGSGGEGFHRFVKKDGYLCIDGVECNKASAGRFLESCKGYIVTEYVVSHPELQAIYDITPNTVRIVAINDENEGPVIVGAFIRFGVASSGMVDNVHAGGVFAGVDVSDGRIFSPKRVVKCGVIDVDEHPDTNVPIRGYVPNWDKIKKGIRDIGLRYPQLVYMGYDLIVTDFGFVFVEINSHVAPQYIQCFYPLLDNSIARRVFREEFPG